MFCTSAGMMHVGSAMTHVYPDDVYLEKLDHLGIATLVMGTPISTIMVRLLAASTMLQSSSRGNGRGATPPPPNVAAVACVAGAAFKTTPRNSLEC